MTPNKKNNHRPKKKFYGTRSVTKNADDYKTVKKPSDKRVSTSLKQYHLYLYQLDQRDLKYAIQAAENPDYPDRRTLYAIYKETFRDLHIKSQIITAIEKVNAEEWAVVDWDKLVIDRDWTMFLDTNWFQTIGEIVNLEEFWGPSVMEFQQMVETSERYKKLAPFTFKAVKLIPREHYRPETGELLLRPWDTKGVNIRELGLQDNFMMECGNPTDLGLLQDLSRVYIFKKFSTGDWSQSSEKWTDPILIIQTASDNDVENDKKMEWATNVSKNRAALLDDQDKITMLESKATSGNAHKVYLDFVTFLNEELSKGINGQTGTSDQKSFVGSAEVHERLLDDYTTSRLRKRFYFHNNETFPFLQSKGFKLENKAWVPTKFFKRFMAQYSLEPENITPPAPGKKDPNNQDGGGSVKLPKKLSNHQANNLMELHELISDSYTCSCGQNHFDIENEDYSNGLNIDDAIDRAIKRLYERNVKAGKVDTDLVNLNAESLWEAIKSETGTPDMFDTKHKLMLQMRHNAKVTAVFKNYSNQQEVVRELFDKNGNIRSFNDFKKSVKPIMENYNKNYLKTEYNFAKASARAAMQWQDYEEKGGKITYWTIGDGRVREKHAALNKTTKPVGDKFWDLYYPPIQGDWGCRCYTRWASEDTPDVEPESYPVLKPGAGGNVGKTGVIFNQSSPYYKTASLEKGAPNYFGQKVPIGPEKIKYNSAQYHELIKSKDHNLLAIDNLNGGFVFTEKGVSKEDIAELKNVAAILASKGDVVVLKKIMNLPGVKNYNPDMYLNGGIAEFKANASGNFNTLDYLIRKGSKQADRIILQVADDVDVAVLEKAIQNRVRQRFNILFVEVIFKGQPITITREEILNKTFIGKIK